VYNADFFLLQQYHYRVFDFNDLEPMTAIPYQYHFYLTKYYWDESWKYCYVPEVPVTEELNKYQQPTHLMMRQ